MYSNDNVEYARNRLNGTIITHMGKAVEVIDVSFQGLKKPLEVVSTEIITGNIISDKIDNYDLKPVKLGFVNTKTSLYYIARMPLRNDWRQGFRKAQVAIKLQDGRGDIDMVSIANTIENIFPSIEEVREELKGKRNAMKAFCREFCIDAEDHIYYRAFGKIGNFIKGTREFLLDANFFWTEERLKEVV